SLRLRRSAGEGGHLDIIKLNDRLEDMNRTLRHAFLHPPEFKKSIKDEAKAHKKEAKNKEGSVRRRVFVIEFDGDLQASKVSQLRNEITAVLTGCREQDEVL